MRNRIVATSQTESWKTIVFIFFGVESNHVREEKPVHIAIWLYMQIRSTLDVIPGAAVSDERSKNVVTKLVQFRNEWRHIYNS